MGLFSRKVKTSGYYSLGEAMKLLEEYQDYTTIPVMKNGVIRYKVVPVGSEREEIDAIKANKRNIASENDFANRINGNGAYLNMGTPRNYNDYQRAKRYSGEREYYI